MKSAAQVFVGKGECIKVITFARPPQLGN
jgi:hypothetical protein